MAIRDYSQTPGSNSTIGGINVAEGCNPSVINNAIRQLMADAKELAASSSIASASTVSAGATNTVYLTITGNTTITAFDSVAAGVFRVCEFTSALTLTHNATSFILPGAANITTAAGDAMIAMSKGSGNWKVTTYERANGAPIALTTAQVTTVYLADGAVTADKLDNNAVSKTKFTSAQPGSLISWDKERNATAIPQGTAGHVLTSNGSAQPTFQASVSISSYASAGQSISAGEYTTLAHPLSAAPKLIVLKLKCTDAGGEGGYAQNDEVFIPVTGMSDSGFGYGVMCLADTTNIYVKQGALSTPFFLLNKTTGNVFNCTNSKWQLLVYAYTW